VLAVDVVLRIDVAVGGRDLRVRVADVVGFVERLDRQLPVSRIALLDV
jgi:hypothetical protein